MDAVTSFTHLVDNIPLWSEQLRDLSTHTKNKNVEFVAEYARLVKAVRPKRLKSPSIASIHSDGSRSAHLPEIDPVKESGLPTPEPQQVDPLIAGNRHLYADQTAAQRKRKSNASLRSGASGPQKFRSKHQVVIYYDGYVQEQLEAMVKTIGIARNNLRKGKNALNASRGFRLPTISKRYDGLTTPSLENIRTMSKYRASGLNSSGSKSATRLGGQQPQDQDEAAFLESDKILETVQNLYETAAHQFLRDGDCLKELNSAETKLQSLVETAKSTVETLKEKAKQQAAEEEAETSLTVDADDSRRQSTSEQDCPSLLTDKSSLEPLRVPALISKPAELSALNQTLEGMKAKGITTDTPAVDPSIPQAGMTIEVDDGSDGGSFENFDISQFRSANRMRMRP